MAKKRRRTAEGLTPKEMEYLCRGYTIDGEYFGDPEPFENKEQAREAWENNSDEVRRAFKEGQKAGEYREQWPWALRAFGEPGTGSGQNRRDPGRTAKKSGLEREIFPNRKEP